MTCKVCCKSGYIKQKLFSKYIYMYITKTMDFWRENIIYIYIYLG